MPVPPAIPAQCSMFQRIAPHGKTGGALAVSPFTVAVTSCWCSRRLANFCRALAQPRAANSSCRHGYVTTKGLIQLHGFQRPNPLPISQARRASDDCLFMLMGKLVEHGRTVEMFVTPKNPKTAEYIEGRYG